MKHNHLILYAILILASKFSFAQQSLETTTDAEKRFSTYVTVGIGGALEKKFTHCEKRDNGRAALSVSQFMRVTDHYSIGIEGLISGALFRYYRLGDGGPCEGYEPITNTYILNYNNLSSSSFFFRNRFTVHTKCASFFADMGIGLTEYAYNSISASRTSFVVSPELGVSINDLQISCKMVLGGRTPSFEGFSDFRGANLSLTSIRSQQVYIAVAYRLFQF